MGITMSHIHHLPKKILHFERMLKSPQSSQHLNMQLELGSELQIEHLRITSGSAFSHDRV